ncbi:MAG TPA: alpha/beta fold hydrolase [Gemmatimonadales bacterium]|nr:alpha/beta fold hydrolase [Gemmatimonadales bacterium]
MTAITAAGLLVMSPVPGGAQTRRTVPQYTIEQFMNTSVMFGASFAPDERTVLVTSDRSGVFNVWEVPAQGGAPRQVTTSTTDGIFAIGFLPGERRFMYNQDRGGNENDHLYLQAADGTVRDLTPGDSLKAVFYDWSADDKSFFFGTNARDRRYFDVFTMSIATLTPREVFRDTVGYTVGAISGDGRWMALTKEITTQNNDMYLRDGRSGAIRHISPHTGEVQHAPQVFSPDGSYLYFLTNQGSDFQYLARYNLATGTRDTVERADWDVMYAYFSKHGKYLVVGINNDARTEIRVYEAATHRRVSLPAPPAGDITGVSISPSEARMAFYVNGARSPSNLFVMDLARGTARQLTQNLSPDLDATNLVDAQVARFASYDGVQIPVLLYRPQQVTAGDRAPAVLWIHGGPGGQTRIGYSAFTQYLANHGYVVLAVNNRGSSGYGKAFNQMDDRRHGEADLDDIVWAKRYLATLGYVDTTRVGIAGGSYGGYLTLAGVTFRPDVFAVGVDFFGISNWVRTLRSIPPWWESFRTALYTELGDPGSEDSVRLYRVSPLFHADQIKKPLLVLQGANDPRVLKAESDQIVEAVRQRGGVAEYVIFPDEGHGFIRKENNIKAYRTALEFLDHYLRAQSASP